MKKRNFIPLLAAALLLTGCGTNSSSGSQSVSYSRDIFAMDTYMSIRSYGGSESALDAAEKRIHDLEAELSVTVPDSDISRINSCSGKPVEVSSDTLTIVKNAIETGVNVLTAIETGAPVAIGGEDGRRTIELITAIYESGSLGHSVELPLQRDDPFYTVEGIRRYAPHFHEKTVSQAELGESEITLGSFDRK